MGNIVIVSGSPAKFSRSAVLANFIGELLRGNNHIDYIKVNELPPEDLIYARWDSETIIQSIRLIENADAIVVISPVYKATYTGLLKTFLDLLPEKSLANKVIFPILNGGTVAHLLALEYSFKPLFSVLGATSIVDGVYVVDSQVKYHETELEVIDNEVEQRIKANVNELVNRLNQTIKIVIKG